MDEFNNILDTATNSRPKVIINVKFEAFIYAMAVILVWIYDHNKDALVFYHIIYYPATLLVHYFTTHCGIINAYLVTSSECVPDKLDVHLGFKS